jgi:4-amino-4-deoxy-L-arabinose transferase-like glycosyltransferase
MRDRADRLDYLIAVGVSLLTILSRLPFRARMLYNWDAVQFALALREYDVVKHQPHPPGYILYVALGRLVHGWVGDPAAAYVLLAVAFSGGGTFVVYLLARAVYDRPTAVTAATLLAVSPLFWPTSPSARCAEARPTRGWRRATWAWPADSASRCWC